MSTQSSTHKTRESPNSHKQRTSKMTPFPDYMSPQEVESGVKSGQLFKGVIRINPKYPRQAFVENQDGSKPDHVISSLCARNRALDADEVVLRSSKTDENEKFEVVHIAKKVHPRIAVGHLTPITNNKNFALFTPRDQRVPKMRIHKTYWPNSFATKSDFYSNVLFLAKISKWEDAFRVKGEIVDRIGPSGNLSAETSAIIREFRLSLTTSNKWMRIDVLSPTQDEERRQDETRRCVFTIDNEHTTDMDDAVSCQELANGNFEVGVHISDVTHFLRPKTELDDIARKKSTSVYLVDGVDHLLPPQLRDVCSLSPGSTKRTFSLFWEITPGGRVVSGRGAKTAIVSCCRLTYRQAQNIIDDLSYDVMMFNNFTRQDLGKALRNLHTLVGVMRRNRLRNAGLSFSRTDTTFLLHPMTGEPTEIITEARLPSQELIEELMLLTNVTVAERVYDTFPSLALLRTHGGLYPHKVSRLKTDLEALGIHINTETSQSIQVGLNQYSADNPARERVLRRMLIKTMKRERYVCGRDCNNTAHFALGFTSYTHFTSPIRRYADVISHRLLAACLRYTSGAELTSEEVAEIANNCNARERHAKRAEDASNDLYLCYYIERHQPYVQDAVVCFVNEDYFDVNVFNIDFTVRVYANDFDGNWIWKCAQVGETDLVNKWRMKITFPETATKPEQTIFVDIFSIVKVQLIKYPRANRLKAQLYRT